MGDVNAAVSLVLFNAIREQQVLSRDVFVRGVRRVLARDDTVATRQMLTAFNEGRPELTNSGTTILCVCVCVCVCVCCCRLCMRATVLTVHRAELSMMLGACVGIGCGGGASSPDMSGMHAALIGKRAATSVTETVDKILTEFPGEQKRASTVRWAHAAGALKLHCSRCRLVSCGAL